jgi:hypothetical protein
MVSTSRARLRVRPEVRGGMMERDACWELYESVEIIV